MKDNWPEEFPKVEKIKKERSSRLPFILMILALGILIGICMAAGVTYYIFYDVEPDTVAALKTPTPVNDFTPTTRPTHIPNWTPDVPDGAGQPRPTMTPFRPVGIDGTLFTVHFYLENFVGETAAIEQVTFPAASSPDNRYEENGVVIRQPDGADLLIEAITLDGSKFGLKSLAASQFDVDFSEPVTGIGLHFISSDLVQESHSRCSSGIVRYDITFKMADAEIATLSNHGSDFLGAATSNPFDRVEIRRSDGGPAECAELLGPIFVKYP